MGGQKRTDSMSPGPRRSSSCQKERKTQSPAKPTCTFKILKASICLVVKAITVLILIVLVLRGWDNSSYNWFVNSFAVVDICVASFFCLGLLAVDVYSLLYEPGNAIVERIVKMGVMKFVLELLAEVYVILDVVAFQAAGNEEEESTMLPWIKGTRWTVKGLMEFKVGCFFVSCIACVGSTLSPTLGSVLALS